jgi:hypothetical protein
VQKISLVKNEQECEKRKGAGEKIQSDYMGHIKMAYWLREKEKFHVSNHQSYRAAAALSLKLHQATFPSRSWLNCGKIHFEFRLPAAAAATAMVETAKADILAARIISVGCYDNRTASHRVVPSRPENWLSALQ